MRTNIPCLAAKRFHRAAQGRWGHPVSSNGGDQRDVSVIIPFCNAILGELEEAVSTLLVPEFKHGYD